MVRFASIEQTRQKIANGPSLADFIAGDVPKFDSASQTANSYAGKLKRELGDDERYTGC